MPTVEQYLNKTSPSQQNIISEKMEGGKMFEKVICLFYSVGYCKFKDHCHKEHPKEDCCNSSCPK